MRKYRSIDESRNFALTESDEPAATIEAAGWGAIRSRGIAMKPRMPIRRAGAGLIVTSFAKRAAGLLSRGHSAFAHVNGKIPEETLAAYW